MGAMTAPTSGTLGMRDLETRNTRLDPGHRGVELHVPGLTEGLRSRADQDSVGSPRTRVGLGSPGSPLIGLPLGPHIEKLRIAKPDG